MMAKMYITRSNRETTDVMEEMVLIKALTITWRLRMKDTLRRARRARRARKTRTNEALNVKNV